MTTGTMKIAFALTVLFSAAASTSQAFQQQQLPQSKPVVWRQKSSSSSSSARKAALWGGGRAGSSSKREVVLEPNYSIAASVAAAAPIVLGLYESGSALGVGGALVHAVLATYLFKQTQRVRCVFDDRTFEFKNLKGDQLVTKPNKNYVKGTVNRWTCAKTVDFGYIPAKSFPLITYFYETETPDDTWGQYGLWGKIWSGVNKKGPSAHFFPGFIDIDAWEDEMLKRGAKKKKSTSFSALKSIG